MFQEHMDLTSHADQEIWPRSGFNASAQVAASEEGSAASPQLQRSLHKAAMAVPPLAWQALTPQLFTLLVQDRVSVSPIP